ncbi:hypothetical protein QN277_010775 [Acacia crassicarpa]|uniref:DUF4283 domain-containing protein n=1 Tax=Acacia crassicarpa TaxID=499986 RepID=A0AAE1M4T4_9FABA|nr:hypothetical protein QN277_010775 [Acacia crassicarpa]
MNDMNRVKAEGPWMVQNKYIAVQEWSPTFEPEIDVIKKVKLWVKLPAFPPEFIKMKLLSKVGNFNGSFVWMDSVATNVVRGRFIRICVEVDLSRELELSYILEGKKRLIVYEGLDDVCEECRIASHRSGICHKTRPDRVQLVARQKPQTAETWQVVGKKGGSMMHDVNDVAADGSGKVDLFTGDQDRFLLALMDEESGLSCKSVGVQEGDAVKTLGDGALYVAETSLQHALVLANDMSSDGSVKDDLGYVSQNSFLLLQEPSQQMLEEGREECCNVSLGGQEGEAEKMLGDGDLYEAEKMLQHGLEEAKDLQLRKLEEGDTRGKCLQVWNVSDVVGNEDTSFVDVGGLLMKG